MTAVVLQHVADALRYDDMPEEWRVANIAGFSREKRMHDFQQNALKNAATLLRLYFVNGDSARERNMNLAAEYLRHGCAISRFDVRRYDNNRAGRRSSETGAFQTLAPFCLPQDDKISYEHYLCNRMSFWMATGSGKTLVMVKIIAHLWRLMSLRLIPRRPVLVLAPGDTMLDQIKASIDEFNQAGGLQMEWMPLPQLGVGQAALPFGDSMRVYYYRADNISDSRKEALLDYRDYENDGKWYVLLDEAHKGDREESRRQARYSLFARAGFLFNFSATFVDDASIAACAFKYNLQEFVEQGYGKRMLFAEDGFESFRRNGQFTPNDDARRKILLKSLLTLACSKLCATKIRRASGQGDAYHEPMMMTLVNSVSTDAVKNDLWAFFGVLRGIARGDIDKSFFEDAKRELRSEWGAANFKFEGSEDFVSGRHLLAEISVAQMRRLIFHSPKRSELDALDPENGKELAFQLRGADSPFALLRIGDIGRWRGEFLRQAGITARRQKITGGFFGNLENGRVSILIGSRAFVEGWDSNRPNVINFVNIGQDATARKFITQTIGRGVRIEPLSGLRRRQRHLPSRLAAPLANTGDPTPVETLFVYSSNRQAVDAVMRGLEGDGDGEESQWRLLRGFKRQSAPDELPLLAPKYRESSRLLEESAPFVANKESWRRLRDYLNMASDSALAVSLSDIIEKPAEIDRLRRTANAATQTGDKRYDNLGLMIDHLCQHLRQYDQEVGGMRRMEDGDIVHFFHIATDYGDGEFKIFQEKIKRVSNAASAPARLLELAEKLKKGEIDPSQHSRLVRNIGEENDSFEDIHIRYLADHYYVPLLVSDKAGRQRVRHAISAPSESNFLRQLKCWLETNKPQWNKWMFCKLDETLDKIGLPYYDGGQNRGRSFCPDFIFWMKHEREYRIVFVDPHGVEHAETYRKIDGFKRLFEDNDAPKKFMFSDGGQKLRIQVRLLLFNKNKSGVPERYRRFYTSCPGELFSL